MKKKLLTLITLALGLFGTTSAWADAETIGLTQTYSSDEKIFTAPVFTGTSDGFVTNGGEAHGSQCDYGQYTDKDRSIYDCTGGTAVSYTGKHYFWKKTYKSTTYSDDQWVGYELTIADGKTFSITGAHAEIFVGDDTYTWKLQIAKGSNVLYTSKDQTASKTKTADLNLTFTDTDLTNLSDLTGTITVRIYTYQNGNQKYFVVPYLTVTGTVGVNTKATYTVTATANPTEGGSITGTGSYSEGDNATITATPAAGYKFTSWTVGESGTSTDNPYTITSISENVTLTANFEKLPAITFDNSYIGTISQDYVLTNNYADEDGKFTIPSYADKYLYKEGYIFKDWTDGTNTYASGDEITGITADITLTPEWTATTQSLATSTATTTVTWSLAYSDILFNAWQSSNYGYYTQTATVNGEKIAVPMQIANGKLDNSGRQKEGNAQTNQNTKFTIPAVSGMTISISDANTNFSTTTIAGSTEYEGTGSKSISYTYTGTDETIDIVIGESNQYLKSIVVTYPAAPENVTVAVSNTTSKMGTFSSNYNVDFTNAQNIQAYTATYSGGDVVTLTRFTGVLPAKTGVLLYAPNGTYSEELPVVTTADAVTDNVLVGTPAATEIQPTDGTKTNYVLVDGEFCPFTNAGTLAAGKAYLSIDKSDVSESKLSIQFGNGTTGINNINAAETNSGKIYNLNGMEVKNPTQHGIFIQNGKKFIK